MCWWFYLLLLIPAGVLAWEDFRTRRISVAWLVVLAVGSTAIGVWAMGWRSMLEHTAVNGGLLIVMGAVVACYLRLRRYCLPDTFGAGDVVMLTALAPLFTPVEYLRFLLAACCMALLWWIVRRSATIPFAGVMSIALAGYSVWKTIGLWS